MSDVIGELFEERYPGSKQKRKSLTSARYNPAGQIGGINQTYDTEAWGKPVQKTIRGNPIDLYSIGCFARAIDRSIPTIRKWERGGKIPKAPFVFAGNPGPRGNSVSRRYYSEQSIIAVLDAFRELGLTDIFIDWSSPEAKAFTARVTKAWAEEVEYWASLKTQD